MLVVPGNKGNGGTCDVTKAYVDAELKKKVTVVPGKGLSTNDLTNELLDKVNKTDVIFETVEG